MTYREALREFKELILPEIVKLELELAGPDKARRGEAWHNYVDGLARDKQITEKQADSWGNPFNK